MSLKKNYLAHEKGCLFALVLMLYSLGYFLTAHLVAGRQMFTVQLPFEKEIPFIPAFAIVYLSVYLIAIFPFFVIRDTAAYRKIALIYILATLLSYIIFIAFPVQMIRPETIPNNFFGQLVTFIYTVDKPCNCFPSLHVFYPFMSCFAVSIFNRKKGLFLFFWATTIALSTIFIKQHYLLDVLAGMLMALICYLLLKKILK